MNVFSINVMLLLLMFLSACEKPYYSHFNKIDVNGWPYMDTSNFTFQISENQKPYNIYLSIRHNKNYEYNNLWLKVIERDTARMIETKLAQKDGKWLSKCSNTYCLISTPLQTNYNFADTGNYNIDVVHYMRAEKLKGISDIGVIIEEATLN